MSALIEAQTKVAEEWGGSVAVRWRSYDLRNNQYATLP
jgi:hypothetical protein